MKKQTSYTVWTDAVGERMSITYSEIDEANGRVISDNKRIDRIITDEEAIEAAKVLRDYAQQCVDAE